MSKRTVTIDIAGARYRMTSDAGEDHLRRLAEMVEERIQALGAKAMRAASPSQLLAVVALGLADDLLSAEQRGERLEHITREVVDKAIARIDERLEADASLAKGADGA
jgi:cell division protein ZapA